MIDNFEEKLRLMSGETVERTNWTVLIYNVITYQLMYAGADPYQIQLLKL